MRQTQNRAQTRVNQRHCLTIVTVSDTSLCYSGLELGLLSAVLHPTPVCNLSSLLRLVTHSLSGSLDASLAFEATYTAAKAANAPTETAAATPLPEDALLVASAGALLARNCGQRKQDRQTESAVRSNHLLRNAGVDLTLPFTSRTAGILIQACAIFQNLSRHEYKMATVFNIEMSLTQTSSHGCDKCAPCHARRSFHIVWVQHTRSRKLPSRNKRSHTLTVVAATPATATVR